MFEPLGVAGFVGHHLPRLDHTATIVSSQRERVDVAEAWVRGLGGTAR